VLRRHDAPAFRDTQRLDSAMQFEPRQYPPTLHKPPARSRHEAEPGEVPMPAEPSAWWVICTVGGPIWLGVTCMTLLGVVRGVGPRIGRYIATTGVCALQHALVFLVEPARPGTTRAG
jgi:hypothetical protein